MRLRDLTFHQELLLDAAWMAVKAARDSGVSRRLVVDRISQALDQWDADNPEEDR